MKNTLSIIITSLTISCTSFKEYRNQEYKLINQGKQTFIYNNQPLLEISINDQKGYFLFDTGATGSIITDSVFLNKIKSGTNLKKTNSLSNASGFTLEAYKILTKKITSPIFDSKNIILSYYKINKNLNSINNCKNATVSNANQGIIGLNNFISSEKTIILNFDENTIEVVNENFDKTDYQQIEASLQTLNKKIIIPLTLNNKKINFLFDTGNSGGLLVNEKEFKNLSCDFEGEMMIGNFNGFSTQKIKIYKNAIISGLPLPIENQNITTFNPFATNTMGMKFITKFNWLLDFKNKKVYIQKNKTPFKKDINEFNNLQTLAINNKLLIGFKSCSITNFNINDEIISVNNKLVTHENICEMQNLLNSTANWDELKIKIKKP